MLEQNYQALMNRREEILSRLMEIKGTVESVEELGKSGGNEVFLPIGAGVLVPVKFDSKKKLIIGIGSDIVLEKGVEEIKKDLEKRMEMFDQAAQAVRYAREAGIKTVGHFILGLPGETEASLKQTVNYARSLPLDLAQFYCAVPFPGSRLYDRALEEGWITRPDYSCFKQDCALMELPTISSDEVNRYRTLAYKRFYGNVKSICKTLTLINWKDVGRLVTAARDFWKWSNK